ncbi:tRNA isopentenyltransferase [Phellopilus nigrolimitatus]|nr:tRNA isopentenyltransferase [Phellopilus nigrolimitatus]
MSLKPLIVICGTTGVGKSRLAIELALELSRRGTVINADAMQVYEGLDVLTNKVPAEEQRGVEHLLMDFKKPGEQYVVGEWVQDAVREIDKIHGEEKIPIVVGGTSYWIHHLLFPNTLPSRAGSLKHSSTPPSPRFLNALRDLPKNLADLYDTLPTTPPSAESDPANAFALHSLLSHLDPTMASRWHWKDTRKVLRNLEIMKENSRLASEVIADAHAAGITGRYRSLIFWLYAEPKALNTRLERRVDEMLSKGLLEEVRSVKNLSNYTDLTLGVYQAIGYKEFLNFMNDSKGDRQLYDTSVADMKQSTKKYAQRQIKWIRNKLLPAVQACSVSSRQDHAALAVKAFLLDATDDMAWEEKVLANAIRIAEAFLQNFPTPDPLSISLTAQVMLSAPTRPTDPKDILQSRRKLTCTTCTTDVERPFMLEVGHQWEIHQRTRVHKRLMKKASSA